jgi:hypothetical protein
MSNNELQYSGEFNLLECKLITSSGNAVDLSTGNQILEIDIYEDIFKGGLTGSIFIADTHSLITALPIVGHEGLSIKIQTPGFTEKHSSLDFTDRRMFIIHKISLRAELSKGAQVYELKFASQELLIANRITVSKSYTANISTIIKDVLTSEKYIGTQKKLFIESTQGVRKIVVPNSHPYTFINRLVKESISTAGSPHYMFFENADGFHFRTLQDLYKQKSLGLFHYGENTNTNKGSHRTTHFEPKNETIVDLKRILEYELHNNNDMFHNSRNGMLTSTNIAHDIYSKKYVKTKYDYFNDFNKFQRISKTSNPKYSKNTNLERYSDARFFLHPISTTGGNDANYSGNYTSNKKDETFFIDRQSRMFEIAKGTALTLTIAGNTAMRVGKTLNIDLPIIGVDHDDKKIDKYLSGNFMVQKIRHRFQIVAKTHYIHMELAKDCVETRIT